MLKSYRVGWWGGVGWGGGPCDFSVSPSPFGLDFGTLDFGLGLGLDNTFEIGINKIVHQGLYLYPSTGMQNNSKTTVSDNFQVNFFNKLTRVI